MVFKITFIVSRYINFLANDIKTIFPTIYDKSKLLYVEDIKYIIHANSCTADQI